ncbi:hypothetical protein [Pontibacter vulgaris]|uniref:hypothetical protein n=1 Tax=Pontibacter vulgaris TaxID=2905679 RepID=UPI001FA80FB4|nr:hypothetical protein [Pontibacter vulgaris]
MAQSVTATNASGYKITDLREHYLMASKSSENARRFNDHMYKYKESNPVILAYRAASEATMAKHAWNPYQKMKHINKAAELFDEAVKRDSHNPEIRFLRFTMEHYVPRYLNMSAHLEEDKKYIIDSLRAHPRSGFSTEWARILRDFMLQKDHSTEAEKKLIRSLKI